MEAEFLAYEQDNVLHSSAITSVLGKLQIVEAGGVKLVWRPCTEEGDWSVVKDSSSVSYNQKHKEDVNISRSPQQNGFRCSLTDLTTIRVSQDKKDIFLLHAGEIIGSFTFTTGDIEYLIEVIGRYVSMHKHPEQENEYLINTKAQDRLDKELAALNLLESSSKRSRAYNQINHLAHAPKYIFNLLHDVTHDPYNTAVATWSKLNDYVLYGGSDESPSEDQSPDILRRVSGFDDFEPGYELITTRTMLAERPTVERMMPISQEEFFSYVSSSGRITEVDKLKQRIFKGGIAPNLRDELWRYLLAYYHWGDTTVQRKERIQECTEEYNRMKHQWKTFSKEQEENFTGFRDRKSLIEKDVYRTDRSMPYFEGEDNTNLVVLNDILMTYVMYNFDLGYVQGMSDLLAPILVVVDDEVAAFWCFVGLMKRMHKNFELTQQGMKDQLCDLRTLLQLVDPAFVSFLQSQESSSLTFCFRWILVRFKREFRYYDILRLWDVLWTGVPCENFHLLFAVAILCAERNKVIDNKLAFAEVLKHINELNYRIDLDKTLIDAEAIYLQLKATETLQNSVREILELPLKVVPVAKEALSLNKDNRHRPGHVERVQESPDEEEKSYEKGLSNSYM